MDRRVSDVLRDAETAARAGRRRAAARSFRAVLASDPGNVAALLWLVWLSDDAGGSLAYASRAVSRAPNSAQTRAALDWARRRAAAASSEACPAPNTVASVSTLGHWGRAATVALGLLAVLIAGVSIWGLSQDTPAAAAPAPAASAAAAASRLPGPIFTATATLSPTGTPAPSPTPVPSGTPRPTGTATATSRAVSSPAPSLPPPATLSPYAFDDDQRWIEVNLTHQRLNAYEGRTLVRTMLVSTGLARTPTPIGLYAIRIKLRLDDMQGADYYLPNVPYVMYFHRGYGLHGTYWHANFGHTASHGCVNLPTAEARWLFEWAEVGTPVYVHY